MWVRAQVDYLQRLPHDMEKRKALEELPPDLPETYIRILQTIDSAYGGKTKIYIQRLLKWLVLKISRPSRYMNFSDLKLTAETLCQAICIENENDWPTAGNTPTVDQIMRWLGCMIRVDQHKDTVDLSHFTVREFLTMSAERVAHSVAQRYLVNPKDEEYIANVCLTYSMHSHFRDAISLASDNMEGFISEHPFWRYVAPALCDHVSSLDGAGVEDNHRLRNFLSMPTCLAFEVWGICYIWLDGEAKKELDRFHGAAEEDLVDVGWDPDYMCCLSSTLHFASIAGLPCQTRKLLVDGADPNASVVLTKSAATPLHLAIHSTTGLRSFTSRYPYLEECLGRNDLYGNDDMRNIPQRSLQMSKILIEFGADIDRQVTINMNSCRLARVTPFVLAVMCGNWEVASLLLAAGADWNATADIETEIPAEVCWNATAYVETQSCDDLCSIKTLFDEFPEAEHIVRRAVELSPLEDLTDFLNEWRLQQESTRSSSRASSPTTNNSTNPQDAFIFAFLNGDWQQVEEILKQHSALEVNCLDEDGFGAIHDAAYCEEGVLVLLLEYGADPNLRGYQGATALSIAAEVGDIKNVRILLDHGSDLEARGRHGYTPLLFAVYYRNFEVAQLLVDAGAEVNATIDDGAGALHLAVKNEDTAMFSMLLERGINSNLPDHYGSTPLHEACRRRLAYQAKQLLERMAKSNHSLDDHSLKNGTPLYIASRKGFDDIMETLLDHGAAVDKVGPGNELGAALMAACAEDHSVAVKLLLSRGAALEVEGSRFGSAIETARVFRKEEIVRILEEHAKSPMEEDIDRANDGTSAKRPGEDDDSEDTQHEDAEQKLLTIRSKSPAVEQTSP